MPTFNDSENIPPLLPEGDYIWCCTDFSCCISNTAKTGGADKYELDIEIEPSGKVIYEKLIDHKSCAWVIDTFLKSAGVQIKKGEGFEFRADKAKSLGLKWVNPIGLRGWCKVIVDTYYDKNDTARITPKKANKILLFYTDKPKLPPRSMPVEDEKPF